MQVETIVRAQQGDPAALEEVLRHLAAYLGRICGAIALDGGDDALQESMILIARSLPALRNPAALRGWARRIAVREAVRCASRREVPVDPSQSGPLDVAVVDQDTTAVEVRAVLESLEPMQRAALVLRHVVGLNEAEMAEVLGVAKGTVKSRVHRARIAFRERWAP